MSRSRKKNSICGNAKAESEKEDKQITHRIFRRRSKRAIQKESEPPESFNEVRSTWDFAKDGKQYFDEEKHPELMRK